MPLSETSAMGQTNPAVLQAYYVVEVAPDVPGRFHVAEYLIVGIPWERPRQNRLLCSAGDIELVLQSDQLVARRHRISLLFEVLESPLDGDLQIIEVYGLGDEVECPPFHRSADVLHVAVGRYDDAPDIVAGDIRYPL